MHADIQALYLRPENFLPPRGIDARVALERIDVNEWPLYRVSPVVLKEACSPEEPRPSMLYMHGGGFYREINEVHWRFVCQVAQDTGLDVLVPIYPLIPRPAATASQLIPGMIDLCRLRKQPVVCIAGDSAGGTLALGTAQHAFDTVPDVAARLKSIILISPLLDCAVNHPELLRLDKTDPWLGVEGCRVVSPMWAGDLSTTDPMASPLYGDITHLPPMLLLCGTADMLCVDSRRLSARFQGKDASECIAGSVKLDKFTYIEEADMLHVYPLLPHWEGGLARRVIMDFVSKSME
jgi:acetyl esterase/lipase